MQGSMEDHVETLSTTRLWCLSLFDSFQRHEFVQHFLVHVVGWNFSSSLKAMNWIYAHMDMDVYMRNLHTALCIFRFPSLGLRFL